MSVKVCVGIGGSTTEVLVFERFMMLLTFDSTFDKNEFLY